MSHTLSTVAEIIYLYLALGCGCLIAYGIAKLLQPLWVRRAIKQSRADVQEIGERVRADLRKQLDSAATALDRYSRRIH